MRKTISHICAAQPYRSSKVVIIRWEMMPALACRACSDAMIATSPNRCAAVYICIN